jgi:diketogulonate reductase-like aldo/keto reductase
VWNRLSRPVFEGSTRPTSGSTTPKFGEVVRRAGKTPAQVVFRFALQSGILPLTGATNPHHMRENLESLEFELPGEDVKTIENLLIAF